MAIFALADLHLSLGADKPMDIFPGWENYRQRLETGWKRLVGPQDTVVIPGDVSWAMQLEHCTEDFAFLESLPGKKILGKGNHDYWWTTMRKMENFLESNGFSSISFLFNNCRVAEDVALCGTRSWMMGSGEAHDDLMIARELGRLRTSLQAAGEREKLVFLHYPPLFADQTAQETVALLKEFGVKECYYGHLHGSAVGCARQGEIDGIRYKLVSADSLGFVPWRVR